LKINTIKNKRAKKSPEIRGKEYLVNFAGCFSTIKLRVYFPFGISILTLFF